MQLPIIRTYRGATQAAAAQAYQADVAQADGAGYVPVSHRWSRDWDGHTLAVAYEQRAGLQPADAEVAPAAPDGKPDQAGQAGQAQAERTPVGRRASLNLQVIDMHCAGEPLRLIRSGFPAVPHLPVLERRRWVEKNADHVRRAIINEPRGHRDMYGAVVLPPYGAGADACLLFMHNEGYSTMCGHGVIAVTTALVEEGLVPATAPITTITFEVPAGRVIANATTERQADGSHLVSTVRFDNVPSYLAAESLTIQPDGLGGSLSVDIAYGGAYYGIVDAADLGLRVVPDQAEALRRAGAMITDVLRRDHTPDHPTDADLGIVYGTIIVDHQPATSADGRAKSADIRNATVFADAELDRSPCGSGTSAILAQLFGRGRMQTGDSIVNAGITGEAFVGRIEGQTQLGSQPAIQTSIAGSAYITGYANLLVDDRDPLAEGFLLG